MAESTDRYVALFIDWDNLAISIAADMGGLNPDVKLIVHKAQEYGRILVARAYAEWNTMSERLMVYRAGVEPVYAPTFRFETDPITQATRGKSLADPVMVADCIDSLHIMPQVSTYVIVTGDKDLIPVVRLAQLRGRRVIVIGPDFVAGVLKEMADEFISYRTLVHANGVQIAAAPPPRPREAAAPAHRRPSGRGPAGTKAQPPKVAPAPPARAAVPMEEREPEPAVELPDLPEVFAALVEILRQMATSGRTRVRATNLKDQLLVRVPGFSERRYGFSKFKDLLLAAERGGLVTVSAAGPVHWVSLPAPEAEVQAPAPVEAVETPTPEVEVAAVETREEEVRLAAEARRRRLAVVRFIDELRQRSRWLTYTYVLTNIIGFIGRLVPAGEAEGEARSILNFLVAEGALRIDKVPQEVDVGGIKHRVRMCHFVEEHSLAHEARAIAVEDLPAEFAEEMKAAERPQPPVEAPVVSAEPESVDRRPTPAGEPSIELDDVEVSRETPQVGGNGRVAEPEVVEELAEAKPASPSRSRRGRRRPKATTAPQTAVELEAGAEPAIQEEAPAAAPSEVPAEEAAPEAEKPAAGEQKLPLEQIFDEVRHILTDLAAQGKMRVTGSSLKLRLSRAHGGFDERQYGFTKFKDFLKAAERAGCASVEMEGQVSWVRPPQKPEEPAGEPEPGVAQPAAEEPATEFPAAGREEVPAEGQASVVEATEATAVEIAPVTEPPVEETTPAAEEPAEEAAPAEEATPAQEPRSIPEDAAEGDGEETAASRETEE